MLQKIIALKNIGRFRNCAFAGDVTFRRVTLIFAENGRGKTTLCAILRSLLTNQPALVLGRTTLGSAAPPDAQLLFAGGSITFRNGVWSQAFPSLAIFDGQFVSDNVFAGDVVDTEHRRNLYRVIIGSQGVTLAAGVNQLDADIRAKNNEIRDSRARLQLYLPSGMTPENFAALIEDPGIEAKIAAKEQELQAVRNAVRLQQRASLAALTIPAFPVAFSALLAKTFAVLAADAEKRVAEHIASHAMQGRGEQWITEGLSVATDSCPFCGQALAGIDLIQAYKDFFTGQYHALRDEVKALSAQVEAALSDRVASSIEQTLGQNGGAVEFWRQYCELSAPDFADSNRIGEIARTLKESAQDLLRAKAGTPLEAVPPDDAFTTALGSFEGIKASLSTYNASVAAANAIIAERKRQVGLSNVGDIEADLARLRAQKARHTPEVRIYCDLDERLQVEKSRHELDKVRMREQLDAHTQQVITQYGQSINRFLERINAGFRITTLTHTYKGGQPSTSYQIVINQNAVDLGDSNTTPDKPSFKNTLSAGDRSTLALAFFLAQLEHDQDHASKIVLFDDPFTSMDSFRRNHTIHQIVKCADTSAQVVILSHEANFLKLIWDRIIAADRKTLQLARVGEDNTTIAEWDIEKALQARYRSDIEALQRFHSLSEGEPRNVVQKIRPVLEGYCRNLYPTQFGDQEMVGSMVGKIRDADPPHPLQPIVEDLDELNIYCRRYHHAENPNAATEAIDDSELESYVKRTLGLVGCLL